MATKGTIASIASFIGQLISQLEGRLSSTEIWYLFAELGLDLPSDLDTEALETELTPLLEAIEQVAETGSAIPLLINELQTAIEEDNTIGIIDNSLHLIFAIRTFITGTHEVATQLSDVKGTLAGAIAEITDEELTPIIDHIEKFIANLPKRVLDYVVIKEIELFPLLASVLEIARIIDRKPFPEMAFPTYPVVYRRRTQLGNFIPLVTSPASFLLKKYGWGHESFDGTLPNTQNIPTVEQWKHSLLEVLFNVFEYAGLGPSLDESNPVVLDINNRFQIQADQRSTPPGLIIRLINGELDLVQYFTDGYEQDDWRLDIAVDMTGLVRENTEIILRPSGELAIHLPEGQLDGKAVVRWTGGLQEDHSYFIFGEPGIGGLEVRQLIIEAGAYFDWDELEDIGTGEFIVKGDIKGGKLFVKVDENGDGFLRKIFAGLHLACEFDVGVDYSSVEGLVFRGSSTFVVKVPLHLDLGGISFDFLDLDLGCGGGGDGWDFGCPLSFDFGFDLNLDWGPFGGFLKGIGLDLDFNIDCDFDLGSFPDLDFDILLGLFNLDFNFKWPKGVGLNIDAAGLKGNGFLEIDHDNRRYAGGLILSFGEIGLLAIGLITTRMPDDSDGFALLVIIGVTFDPAIQLSMGFTLKGVGGLLGVNRSFNVDALRQGIRTHSLDYILFPDPEAVIPNAHNIVSTLQEIFPPEDGQYIIGPMVKIAWGGTLITANVGFFVEFPDPIRIILLGQVKAAIPSAEKALILINLDVIGVLDFAKEELSFQASLYESRLLAFDMAGDAAFLVGWGDNPRFAMAIGGFHPKFTPPPPASVFADMQRLSVSLNSGNGFNLGCQAFQAITSNSIQFGARVDLFVDASPITVSGYLGFDALFIFSPFAFQVEIYGGVDLKFKGYSLFGIDLYLLLAGPTPWHAKGKARIKILFISISVGFDLTWGSDKQATLPPVNPWTDHLKTALEDPDNWGSALPGRRSMVAILRDLEMPIKVNNNQKDGEETQQAVVKEKPIIVHPGGTLEVRQQVCPLNIELEKFSNAPVFGYDKFEISEFNIQAPNSTVGKGMDDHPEEESLAMKSIQEYFARGQYQELTADEKLSSPSFEKFSAGVKSDSSSAIKLNKESAEVERLDYESSVIKDNGKTENASTPGKMNWKVGRTLQRTSILQRKKRMAAAQRQFSASHGSRVIQVTDHSAGEPQKKNILLKKRQVGRIKEERYVIADARNLQAAKLDEQLGQNENLSRMVARQVLEQHLYWTKGEAKSYIIIPENEFAS